MKTATFLGMAFVLFGLHAPAISQTLQIDANFHAAGITFILPTGFDNDHSAIATVQYRSSGTNTWLTAFPPDRIVIGGIDQFRGSVFGLQPSMAYDFEITVADNTPIFETLSAGQDNVAMRNEPNINATNNIKWVSPTGTGTAYSEALPGNISTLLASGLSCGTTVYLKGGSYHAENLSLTINADCSAEQPINIMAAPNETPILEGGFDTPLTWTQSATDPLLFSAALPPNCAYTNLCLLDTILLYPYPTLGTIAINEYNLAALNLYDYGFVRDANTIHIKTASGINPNNVPVVLSKAFTGLFVYGNGHNAFLNLKGITFQHFGKSVVPFGQTGYTAVAFRLNDAKHVTLDNCAFLYNNTPLELQGNCSFATIQNCTIRDQTGYWSHAMVKKSVSDQSIFYPTSLARNYENSGIGLTASANESTTNVVIRNCLIDGLSNAISSSFNGTSPITECDIYKNTITHSFDGIECDSRWVNLRVWENRVGHVLAGVSAAPPEDGPRYFYRNIFDHIESRKNVANDPYVITCTVPSSYFSQGTGIKTNSGATVLQPSAMYFINNTFHSSDSLGFGFYLWGSSGGKLYFVNNIFYSASEHLLFLNGVQDDQTLFIKSNHDNFFNDYNGTLLEVKPINGIYECESSNDADQMDELITNISASDNVIFESPMQQNPLFSSPESYQFTLGLSSQMIEAGVAVAGFYDFLGAVPDLGAIEFTGTVGIENHHPMSSSNDITVFPSLTDTEVTCISQEPMQQLAIYDMFGRLCTQLSWPLGVNSCQLSTVNLAAGGYIVVAQNHLGFKAKATFVKL